MRHILLFILIFLSHQVNAGVIIKSWKEQARLTDAGKNSDILIKGVVRGLSPRHAMSSFSVSFDPRQSIKMKRVISDNNLSKSSKSAKFSFVNNVLTVDFPKGKRNGQKISIYFSYERKYDKINKFLRQEEIVIPPFAAGAESIVVFSFPGSFESATFNPNISKHGNNFIYRGVVPKSGVREAIKLTPMQNIWNVTVKSKVSSQGSLGKFTIKVPIFFQSASHKIENYEVTASATPRESKNNLRHTVMSFDTHQPEVLVESYAKITTGLASRRSYSRNPLGYLKISDSDRALLAPLLQQIKDDPKYGDIPLYVKIGRFVHEFIKYDLSYSGKLPKLEEVLRRRVGVCTEYAKLFEGLARLAKIPAIAVDGGACGEYSKCRGHSWNMIYHDNRWLEVDPTWDLMSGIVSSSHVYMNDFNRGGVGIEYFRNKRGDHPRTSVDLEMSLY